MTKLSSVSSSRKDTCPLWRQLFALDFCHNYIEGKSSFKSWKQLFAKGVTGGCEIAIYLKIPARKKLGFCKFSTKVRNSHFATILNWTFQAESNPGSNLRDQAEKMSVDITLGGMNLKCSQDSKDFDHLLGRIRKKSASDFLSKTFLMQSANKWLFLFKWVGRAWW